MSYLRKKPKVEHLSESELTAYRKKAMRLLDAVLATTQAVTDAIESNPDSSFWVPKYTSQRGLSNHEIVSRALLDFYYDDDQLGSESKQYPAFVRCDTSVFSLIDACNNARAQYRAFWGVVSSIRILIKKREYDFLSSILLKETRYARVNYHQTERIIRYIDGPQPSSMGLVVYSSPNPNRISKQTAWNLAVKWLPDEMLARADSVLSGIPEDESLCYLRENTPRARVNVRQRIDTKSKSRQFPAVLPVFYRDDGQETKFTDSMYSKRSRAARPPSRREMAPLIEGLPIYRYLMPYRHVEQ